MCIYTHVAVLQEKKTGVWKGVGEHMVEGENMEALEGWKRKPVLICEKVNTLFGFSLIRCKDVWKVSCV